MNTLSESGPLKKRSSRKSARFNIPDVTPGSSSDSVKSNRNEITLDVRDDCHSVNTTDVEGSELTLYAKVSEKKTPSRRIHHVPEELESQEVGGVGMKEHSIAAEALKGLKFIINKKDGPAALAAAEKRFDELTKDNGLLHRSRFGECIEWITKKKDSTDSGSMKGEIEKDPEYFSERLFDSLCRRRNIAGEMINKKQFEEFWTQIVNPSFDSTLQTFFDLVDKDGDGKITRKEITEIINLSASENQLSFKEKDLKTYSQLIMEALDTDNLGYITIESLEALMFQEATNNETGQNQNLSQMFSQNLKPTHHENPIKRWYKKLKYLLHDNWKRCWVVVLWIGMMVGLFTWKYIEYKHRAVYDVLGSCVCIAKGAAETLKLNMAIMLLPVCRNTITWLRNKTKLGVAVPFDDNINFHQVIAVAIAIGVGLHAISHLACDFPRLIHATEEEYKPMQQFFGDQAKNYWHFVKEVEGYTGIIMVVLMTIAFTLATPWLRQGKPPSLLNKLTRFNVFKNSKVYDAFVTKVTGFIAHLNKFTGFNVFWYSHHIFVIVYVMLIVHGTKLYLTKEWYKKTTWMYLAIPMLLYTCERLTRTFKSRLHPTRLQKVVVYSKNALALQMRKPQRFEYNSGQYMFVKYADISPFEWHPFSITSAPSDDFLSVHIRDLGDWTKEINNIFRDEEKYKHVKDGNCSSIYFAEGDQNAPKVRIDGPYGAPTRDYKNYDVVLLVGLGIGATPMISIVKHILHNMKAKEKNSNDFKTKRAYFYWVTKEQDSFEWFKSVMNEVAEMDTNGVIEMHNHCTSVYKEGDVRSAIIAMLQKLGYAKDGVDLVSNTRVKSHFGRPNWCDVYKQIDRNHTGSRIGVFYCGTPTLVQELKQLASKFSKDISTSNKFEFHKENF